MPLLIDRTRMPIPWAMNGKPAPVLLVEPHAQPADCLRIALVNNMPDAALEDTELQFFELLAAAARNVPVSVKLFSLPNLPRTDFGESHLRDFYFTIKDLLNDRFDGAIVTGTEPRCPNLREEPYWQPLVQV